jgi:hypothetical protein
VTALRTLLICFGLAAAVVWLLSGQPREQSDRGKTLQSELVLGDRQECPPLLPASISIRLCTPSGRDVNALSEFQNRLSNDRETRAAVLCRYEAEIAQSQRDCSMSNHGDASAVSFLMYLLAIRWQDTGNLDRADEWLQRAYELLDPAYAEYGDPTLFVVLETWARLKVKKGELTRAKELAYRLTTLVRVNTDEAGIGWSGLVRTLKFEARILDQAGFREEARAARKEAEHLSALPDPCSEVEICVGRLRTFPKSAPR